MVLRDPVRTRNCANDIGLVGLLVLDVLEKRFPSGELEWRVCCARALDLLDSHDRREGGELLFRVLFPSVDQIADVNGIFFQVPELLLRLLLGLAWLVCVVVLQGDRRLLVKSLDLGIFILEDGVAELSVEPQETQLVVLAHVGDLAHPDFFLGLFALLGGADEAVVDNFFSVCGVLFFKLEDAALSIVLLFELLKLLIEANLLIEMLSSACCGFVLFDDSERFILGDFRPGLLLGASVRLKFGRHEFLPLELLIE